MSDIGEEPIKSTVGVTKEHATIALESMHKASLWMRIVTLIGVVLILSVIIVYAQITLMHVDSQQSKITDTQQRLIHQAGEIDQTLKILQNATGTSAQRAQEKNLQHLIGCLYNRIDYDSHVVNTLLPGCAVSIIEGEPTTTTTIAPATTKSSVASGLSGTTGSTDPSLFPLYFTLAGKGQSLSCTFTSWTQGTCLQS